MRKTRIYYILTKLCFHMQCVNNYDMLSSDFYHIKLTDRKISKQIFLPIIFLPLCSQQYET